MARTYLLAVILVVMTMCLNGCYAYSPFSFLKLDHEGYYTFREHPIKVKAPDIPSMLIYNTDNFVDFETSGDWWGRHRLQVNSIPENVTDERSFYAYIESYLSRYVVADPWHVRLKNAEISSSERLRIRQRPAFEILAVDEKSFKPPNNPTIIIATAIYFKSRIVVASYLTSNNLLAMEKAESQFLTKGYRTFINSIEESK